MEDVKLSMGWLPDLPSINDFTFDTDTVSARALAAGETMSVKGALKKTKAQKAPSALPATVDLRAWCSPVENQGALGSCTANAGVGLVEYYERRAYGIHIDASRLFLYKVSRNLLRWTGDTGAYLRTTMEALAAFGVPPENYLPYNVATFDVEPSAFCYSFARNYQALQYYRLDPAGTTPPDLLLRIKTYLAANLPSMFGFTVYNSYGQAATTGKIPLPVSSDKIAGGHAIVAVGYDDSVKIKNTNAGGVETTGAILFRNSWGTGWGNAGYGWLPYEYLLRGLAVDWWSMTKSGWFNTGNF